MFRGNKRAVHKDIEDAALAVSNIKKKIREADC
jgi:hypothetical protein